MPIPIIRENDTDKGTFFSTTTFKALGCTPEVVTALRNIGIGRPSHVQVQAFQAFRCTSSQLLLHH